MVSFGEFKKLEMRVAKVVAVEDHPNADKLLVIQADVGGVTKQMVAGLKGHYTAEQLIGKSLVVVTNLEPAKLRGVESQAMLLAAQDGDRVVVIVPEQEVQPGSMVR